MMVPLGNLKMVGSRKVVSPTAVNTPLAIRLKAEVCEVVIPWKCSVPELAGLALATAARLVPLITVAAKTAVDTAAKVLRTILSLYRISS